MFLIGTTRHPKHVIIGLGVDSWRKRALRSLRLTKRKGPTTWEFTPDNLGKKILPYKFPQIPVSIIRGFQPLRHEYDGRRKGVKKEEVFTSSFLLTEPIKVGLTSNFGLPNIRLTTVYNSLNQTKTKLLHILLFLSSIENLHYILLPYSFHYMKLLHQDNLL